MVTIPRLSAAAAAPTASATVPSTVGAVGASPSALTASLADLLALLPDNSTGAIDAADLREVVTGLWDYTVSVQQLVNDLAVRAIPAVQETVPLVGQIASDGTLVGGPDGWGSSYDADTGLYTVTHDLGTEAYAVVITPLIKVEQGVAPAVESTTATSFTFGLWNSATGGLHGAYSNFIVGRLT